MIYDGCPFAYFFFTICLKSDLHARNLTIYIVHLYYNMFIFLSFRQLLVTLHINTGPNHILLDINHFESMNLLVELGILSSNQVDTFVYPDRTNFTGLCPICPIDLQNDWNPHISHV
jgi:hypothetical protein